MSEHKTDFYTEVFNQGYQAGLAKAQVDDDYNFWLRQYAGQAMQGILSHHASNWLPQSTPEALASCAVQTAKALLKELEEGNG